MNRSTHDDSNKKSSTSSGKKRKDFHQLYRQLEEVNLYRKFFTYSPGDGTIDLLKAQPNGEVSYVSNEALRHELIRLSHFYKNFPLSVKESGAMVDFWKVINYAERGLKHLPPPICNKSDQCWAFRRLPFDYLPYETLPRPMHFLEFCNRLSDPDVFQAYIGSLFVPESYRQQYLYVFGHGNDGKGTIFNLLERIFGSSYIAEEVPERSDRFWSSSLIGKRLCVFPELEDATFPTSARFRKLTGDDLIRIEEKFKQNSYGKIFTKFIFASNDELQLTKRRADRRRALYIAAESFEGPGDPLYVENLWKEANAIYSLCLEKYRELCPNHGPIPQHTEKKTSIDFDHENEMDRFFNRYFEPSPKGYITGSQWQAAKYDYFGRKPTKLEENILKDELSARKYNRIRKTGGWRIYGIKQRSALSLIHEKHEEIPYRLTDVTD